MDKTDNKEHIIKKFNKPAVLTMILVLTLTTALAVYGGVIMNKVLKDYAIERLAKWSESIINEAPILETVNIEEEATPGSLEKISYAIYKAEGQNLKEIYSAQVDENIFHSQSLQDFYASKALSFYIYDFSYKHIKSKPFNLVGIYMAKKIGDVQYVMYGYVPDESFFHNQYTNKILIVYYVISATMVLGTISCAGVLVKHIRLARERSLLRTKYEEAEKAEKAQSDFIAKMSHEFRTPLNAILGMNEIIRRESQNEKIEECTGHIEESAQSLLSMINEILDYSKLGSGNFQIREENYDLRKLMEEIEHMFKEQAEKKKLVFTTAITPTCPCNLIGDERHIRSIIINLVSNAIKYTEKGSVTVIAGWDNNELIISVSDTGIGIKEEDIPKMFKKFSRADLEYNKTIEGTGLGLSIVKELLEQTGGKINVNSTYGQGSTFIADIPQKIQTEEILKEGESIIAPDLNVLVVDDTQLNLDVMVEVLKPTQLKINTALSGMEALEKLRENSYDIIFLDARMPEMSGLEAFKAMQKENLINGAKIVMLTADITQENRTSALKAGINEYLEKPVPAHKLIESIIKLSPVEKIQKVKAEGQNKELPDWIINHRELDVKKGIDNCGSEKAYLDSLSRFAHYAPYKITEIQECLRQEDIENFTIKVHAAKSSLRMMGAITLSDMAKDLEEAGNSYNTEYIHSHIGKLLSSYGALACEIDSRLASQKKDTKQAIDNNAIYGILTHMKGYVDDFNDQAVSSMLNILKEYEFPTEIEGKFNEMLVASDSADWVRMTKLIDEMIEIAQFLGDTIQ